MGDGVVRAVPVGKGPDGPPAAMRLEKYVSAAGSRHVRRARKVLDTEIAGLCAVRAQIDGDFDRAVDAILACARRRRKVVVVGIGKSGNVGLKIAATFSSTGTPSVVLNAVDALHGDLGVINDRDVVLALSYSGETDEMLRLLPSLRSLGSQLIAMTGSPGSTLARNSDVVLNVHVPQEACLFNLVPTASTTAMMALGDALAIALMEARGFTKGQYARFHPAGSIGRSLLVRVEDVMRTGERLAIVGAELTVSEGLLAMTRAKGGCVSVVNGKGRLVGVFTDGDLRRRMATDPLVMRQRLENVMTRHPVTVRTEALAAEAIRIFKDRNIDDLVVVNARHEPVGLIDLQDLPRLKLL